MQLNGLLTELSGLLEQETGLYQALLAAIDKEKRAVVATDLEKLNETTKAKENLLLKLRILDEQRSHLLRTRRTVIGRQQARPVSNLVGVRFHHRFKNRNRFRVPSTLVQVVDEHDLLRRVE